MLYRPPNILINFVKYFILVIILHTIFFAVFQLGRIGSSGLLPHFVFACVMSYLNRPIEKIWNIRNKEALIFGAKTALINGYEVADQTKNYIYFRPTSFWRFFSAPVFLDIKADQVVVKGTNMTISGLENQLKKFGAI